MATIYEFVAKDQQQNKKQVVDPETGEVLNANVVSKGGAKGLTHSEYSGSNKGVEHNRYMRAINPMLNKYIPGFEKYVRGGRAALGVANTITETGSILRGLTSVGGIILLQFVIKALQNVYEKQKKEIQEENTSNYAKLITGQNQVAQSVNAYIGFMGKITYKDQ